MKVKAFSDNEFIGTNNISGDIHLRSSVIRSSGNVDLLDSREVKSREGFTRSVSMPGITAAYFTNDQESLYVIASGSLIRVFSDLTTVTLASGLDGSNVFWSELDNRIGLSGSICGVIRTESNEFVPYPLNRPPNPIVTAAAGSLPNGEYLVAVTEIVNGEETPSSPVFTINTNGQAISVELSLSATATGATIYVTHPDGSVLYSSLYVTSSGAYIIGSVPNSGIVLDELLMNSTGLPGHNGPCAFFNSKWHVAHYDQGADISYVYESRIFRFGLFDMVRGFMPVPGKVTMMRAHDDGIIVGTSKGVWVHQANGAPRRVSRVPVPGHTSSVMDHNGKVWFWTRDGLATGLPFEEITAEQLAPGDSSQVSVGLLRSDRADKIVVVTKA